jgi:hypothetical protein
MNSKVVEDEKRRLLEKLNFSEENYKKKDT